MVVLVLVVLWVAVLAPSAIRRVREGRSQTSIESFHEQLHLLERAGPKLVEPAYRLGSPIVPLRPQTEPAPDVDLKVGGRGGLLLLDRPTTERAERRRIATVHPSPQQRQRGRRRRRDILFGLSGTAILTGVVGAAGVHMLWAVTGISVAAIAAYVALAAYVQMVEAEGKSLRPVSPGAPERLPSAWAAHGSRRAAGETGPDGDARPAPDAWAAKAGYPGAWDDEAVVTRRAATGG